MVPGTIDFVWKTGGLVCEVAVPLQSDQGYRILDDNLARANGRDAAGTPRPAEQQPGEATDEEGQASTGR